MMRLRRMGWRRVGLLLAAVLCVAGCEEDEIMTSGGSGSGKGKAAASASASAVASATLPVVEFEDGDFVESEDSRDPFRDYTHLYVKRSDGKRGVGQRKVKAAPFALDELRLAGIITRGKRSIMLTDPTGFGWLIYHGDFVGKAELVSAGGTDGVEVAINWRVDRIRDDSVVFIREDSAHPDIPPTTRVMPLYPAGDDDS